MAGKQTSVEDPPDENLSPRLVERLSSLYPELVHVRHIGLAQSNDFEIWNWAKTNLFMVMTSDADFRDLSERFGSPPKVIHIEHCDFPLRVIEEILRRNAVRITEFYQSGTSGVLSL